MLCWGNASFGQLGLGGIDEEIVLEPRKSDFFLNKRIRDVGCGLRHTVFVLDDGTVYTCGCNDLGQLGHEKARKRPGKFRRNELQCIPVFECVFSLCNATSSPRLSVHVCVLNCMQSSSSKIGHIFNWKKHSFAWIAWLCPHIFACCSARQSNCLFSVWNHFS